MLFILILKIILENFLITKSIFETVNSNGYKIIQLVNNGFCNVNSINRKVNNF